MKTAISLPDPLFKRAETMAEALNISRSQLYARALAEFLDRHDPEAITGAFNEVYASEESRLDPVLLKLQLISLAEDKWE